MTVTPKVSICIPSYREPEFLEEAIRSCLIQRYRDFEVIVSDDTPGECVEAVVARFAAQDRRVRYCRNPGPHGAAANSNHAASQARGGWLKFLHHDDALVGEGALELFMANIDKGDFLFSPCHWVQGETRGIYRISSESYAELRCDPVRKLGGGGNVIGAPSAIMVRREKFAPFDESMVWLFDVYSYLQSAAMGATFFCLDEPVVLINKHKGQLTERVHDDPVIAFREGLAVAGYLAGLRSHSSFPLRRALRLAYDAYSLGSARFAAVVSASSYRPAGLSCSWLAGRVVRFAKAVLGRTQS